MTGVLDELNNPRYILLVVIWAAFFRLVPI
jgi:hypothetical protein